MKLVGYEMSYEISNGKVNFAITKFRKILLKTRKVCWDNFMSDVDPVVDTTPWNYDTTLINEKKNWYKIFKYI